MAEIFFELEKPTTRNLLLTLGVNAREDYRVEDLSHTFPDQGQATH
jgi:hypothetical protein